MAHFFLLCNVLIGKCLTLFPDPYVELRISVESFDILSSTTNQLTQSVFYKTPSQGREISVSFHRCTEKVLEKNLSSLCIARNIKTHRRCRTKTASTHICLHSLEFYSCLSPFFFFFMQSS